MAIVRWTPTRKGDTAFLSEFDRLRNQMFSLFDSFPSPARRGHNRAGVFPALNISEDAEHIYVTAELPGIPSSDLNITVENNKLAIRGERKVATEDKKVNYHRREREAGTFRRVVNLPVKVDAEKVTAVTKNGVLDITLPKAVDAKPRQITVETIS